MQIKHLTINDILHIAVFINDKKTLLIPILEPERLPKQTWLLGEHDYEFRIREDGGVTAHVTYVVDGTSFVIESDADMSPEQMAVVEDLYEAIKEKELEEFP